MGNMMDYLSWRGDLSFLRDPFNDVDNLLFAHLSYIDFQGVVPHQFGESVSFSRAVEAYFDRMTGKKLHLGAIIPPIIFEMARKMAKCVRFSSLRMTGCIVKSSPDVDDPEKQNRWGALALLLEDDTMYVSFGGTDDTLISWKEDFNMAVYSTVPSQLEAASYLRELMLAYPGYRVRLGGHSKGGNLAIYAAAKCGRDLQDRILAVYGNDAPGFHRSFLQDPDYRAIKGRVRLLLPEQAFVGLLLYHDGQRTVVKSREKSIRQHDCFSWEVEANLCVQAEGISGEALLARKAVEAWMNDMTEAERKAFVESVYKALTCLDARTLTDLAEDRTIFLRSFRRLSSDQRKIIGSMLKKLLSNSREVYSSVMTAPLKNPSSPTEKRKKNGGSNTFVTHLDGASLSEGAGKRRKKTKKQK